VAVAVGGSGGNTVYVCKNVSVVLSGRKPCYLGPGDAADIRPKDSRPPPPSDSGWKSIYR